jgi:photosystem II stability/assembly factor-like uncharacterized protein
MPAYSTATKTRGPSLQGWTFLGPGNIGGRTRALVIDPAHPEIVYAGGVAGGIWKSTDQGGSWVPKDVDPNGDLLPSLAICSIAMDLTDPTHSVLYAGTGEGIFPPGLGDGVQGAGIYKSTNAGETWAQLNRTNRANFYYVNDIVVAPSGNVYAATRTGVWSSVDRGGHWSLLLEQPRNLGALDLAVRTDQIGQAHDYILVSYGSFSTSPSNQPSI